MEISLRAVSIEADGGRQDRGDPAAGEPVPHAIMTGSSMPRTI